MKSFDLEAKVSRAVRLLRSVRADEIEISYSGGKDSDVILELAKMAGIKYRSIYKNTTIDRPGTIAHALSAGAEIRKPKISFFDLLKKNGFPSRWARFCCSEMKEYKILDTAVQGIRRCESTARAKRYSESDPIICHTYGSKKNHVNVILPILSWTDKDVCDFIEWRGIKCHPHYYDEAGNFHVERRVGCIGCPLQSDRGLADFKRYPKLARQWLRCGKAWLDNHPNSKTQKYFADSYEIFYYHLFCENLAQFREKKAVNLFGEKIDFKKSLEDLFGIDLTL